MQQQPIEYLTTRFSSPEKAEYFLSLMERNHVALSGSSFTQMVLRQIWPDSDLDVVVAGYTRPVGPSGDLYNVNVAIDLPSATHGATEDTRSLHLIHKFTQPPLNYQVRRRIRRFRDDYARLAQDVDAIVVLSHVDANLPVIQLIFAKEHHAEVRNFVSTFDMHHCQGYVDANIPDPVEAGIWPPYGDGDPSTMLFNFQQIKLQTSREWMRFLARVKKYMRRGMALDARDLYLIWVMLCGVLQSDPRYHNMIKSYDIQHTLNRLITDAVDGIRVTYDGEEQGVYKVVEEAADGRSLSSLVFTRASPRYEIAVSECEDYVLDKPECESLGVRVVFNNRCQTFNSFAEFKQTLTFFKPCFPFGGQTMTEGQPWLCRMPLNIGSVYVPMLQLRACIEERIPEHPLIIMIDSAPYTTYDRLASEGFITHLPGSAIGGWHCQEGTNVNVHLCRSGFVVKQSEHRDPISFFSFFSTNADGDDDDGGNNADIDDDDGGNNDGDDAAAGQQRPWVDVTATISAILYDSPSWYTVAVASEGRWMMATGVDDDGSICVSTDGGRTWELTEYRASISAVAASSDGTKVVAVHNDGTIATSSDSGRSFTAAVGRSAFPWMSRSLLDLRTDEWASVASSADGSKLVVVGRGGHVATSADGGASWSEQTQVSESWAEGDPQWSSVASSSDGTRLVAVQRGTSQLLGDIWTSTDSGASWTKRNRPGNWRSVASSADGTMLVAAGRGLGGIVTSVDAGETWTMRDPVGAGPSPVPWACVASSADGTTIAAAQASGYIWMSEDAGVTWTQQQQSGHGGWVAIAVSADGRSVLAATIAAIWMSVPVGGGGVEDDGGDRGLFGGIFQRMME